ncbi:MAG: dihydroxyacetone kinase subunit DhaL [Actinobacteria bacterium]|nr:dihydroxyacetone kinase subunit DhaL [Actinomycetota bacterium]
MQKTSEIAIKSAMKEKKSLDFLDFKEILLNLNSEIQEKKVYLSEVDSTIGDGDHGTSLAKGFEAGWCEIGNVNPQEISSLLRTFGLSIMRETGGVTGPIFGTMFIEMSKLTSGKKEVTFEEFASMLRKGLDAIKEKGDVKVGDKTLVDALEPAVIALEDSLKIGDNITTALEKCVEAAKNGVEFTKTIPSSKGKSKYLGGRSIGFQDAGATSIYLILANIQKTIEKTLFDTT